MVNPFNLAEILVSILNFLSDDKARYRYYFTPCDHCLCFTIQFEIICYLSFDSYHFKSFPTITQFKSFYNEK